MQGIGLAIVSLFIIGIGVFVILTPAEHLIQLDRKTGYRLYNSVMKGSGDEKRALAAARLFYRCFGGLIVALGVFALCAAVLF